MLGIESYAPFLVAVLLSIILTPIGIKIAQKFSLVDDPKTHKHPAMIHTKVIPRAGGLPIYVSILIASLIFLPMSQTFVSILFAAGIAVLVGLLDDKYDISPYIRFGTNAFCALIVVWQGINLPFITNPFGGIFHFTNVTFIDPRFLAGALAVFWIAWVMNMLNWSKGVDGQLPGIAAISAIVIGIASLRFPELTSTNIETSKMAFIVAGASVGFLFYNFYPSKIFPGYSSTVLGFMIGVLSLLSSVKLATAILVMGVPMVDALFTILRRVLSKKSPFWHDKGHLHHLLLELGFNQRSIAIFYWTMSAVLGYTALNLSSKGKLFAIMLIIVLVVGFIFTLRFIIKRKNGNY